MYAILHMKRGEWQDQSLCSLPVMHAACTISGLAARIFLSVDQGCLGITPVVRLTYNNCGDDACRTHMQQVAGLTTPMRQRRHSRQLTVRHSSMEGQQTMAVQLPLPRLPLLLAARARLLRLRGAGPLPPRSKGMVTGHALAATPTSLGGATPRPVTYYLPPVVLLSRCFAG